MKPELSQTAAEVSKDLKARPATGIHHVAGSSAFQPGPGQESVQAPTVLILGRPFSFQVNRDVDVTEFLFFCEEAAEHYRSNLPSQTLAT